MTSLLGTTPICSKRLHDDFSQVACFSEVSSSLSCQQTVIISVDKLLVEGIAVSMEISLLSALL